MARAVPSGQKIWVRSTGPSLAVLQATAVATVPTGNVYLYDGNAGGGDRQKLILASTATLRTIVQATAEFLRPGSLVVKKTIAGPAAGLQGPVVVDVACDAGGPRPPFTIPARASPGTRSHTYEDIPTGAHCTVIETANGSVAGTVGVVVTRRRTAGDDPSGREQDGPHHRYLSPVRLASRQQDDRRSGRGPAREHHDPHGVQRHRVDQTG